MALQIPLSPAVEARLKREATRRGVDPIHFVTQLIEHNLPSEALDRPDDASLEVLARWEAENATTDPQEIARRQEEGENFMRGLARNRLESEGLHARNLWP